MPNALKTAALAYAANGWSVFPCVPNDKPPAIGGGYLSASCDIETIEQWWTDTPDANIGLPTAGMVVIDVDGADNPYPPAGTDMGDPAISRTPRGGKHYVYKSPVGKEWRNSAGKIAPSVDVRAAGGYIVVSPSTIDGKTYQWLETFELPNSPDDLSVPPAWLMKLLDDIAQRRGGGLGGVLRDGNAIPDGVRNDALYRLGCAVRRIGVGSVEILALLEATNAERCNPPCGRQEVERIAQNAAAHDPNSIQTAVIEDQWTQDTGQIDLSGLIEPIDDTPPRINPGMTPPELFNVPGFIGDVMGYCLATAPYPNLPLAFTGAIALQSILCARKIMGTTGTRPNIYLLALGDSGVGKNHPRVVNTEILHEVNMADAVGDQFASGEGLEDSLVKNPAMLYQTDEIDTMLQKLSKSSDGRNEPMLQVLLSLFSDASTKRTTRTKAGGNGGITINQPSFTLLGTAIPAHFYAAISERMLTNGLFARMLILEAGVRGRWNTPEQIEIPSRIIEVASYWAAYKPTDGNLSGVNPKPTIIKETPAATAILEAWQHEADRDYAKGDKDIGDAAAKTIWARAGEVARKLALLYAASEHADEPIVSESAARWSVALTGHSIRRMIWMAAQHVTDNAWDASALRLMHILRDTKTGSLKWSVLLKRMRMKADDLRTIISTLVERGQVESVHVPTKGRVSSVVRLV